MSFRDDRIHKGKAASEENSERIAPLHLVLLEEPEAHLHVQVQQVLIKKAYEILTDDDILRDNHFKTQLVVSTHSSHIAKEVPFRGIRYFKRGYPTEQMLISTSEVVNLTDTFGTDEKTEKFVQRYLRVTHCDMFFADAVVFVEGTSETVLVPYFIKNDYPGLDSRYITILPIGGSHSHKFKPLIEKLEIATLIITDLDSVVKTIKVDKNGVERTTYPHAFPKRKVGQISGNSSIIDWGILKNDIDYLLDLNSNDKILYNSLLRVSYQTPINITFNNLTSEALSATFEDSLIYENLTAVQGLTSTGLIRTVKTAAQKTTIDEFCLNVYNAIHRDSSGKVSLALELIYELEKVEAPHYIKEGLEWLQEKLRRAEIGIAKEASDDA